MKLQTAFAVLLLVLGTNGSKVWSAPASNTMDLARVDVDTTPALTVVTAYNSQGQQVGKLELLHGRFEMSDMFSEGRDDPWVPGRRLGVSVLDQSLSWETEGFAPTMNLPAHPAGQSALRAFLEDSRVKAVLESHGIGFQSSSGKEVDDPLACDLTGTHPYECSGEATCAILLVRMNPEIAPPGTCGRSVPAPYAWTVYQRAFAGYSLDHLATEEVQFDQSVVAQCCPELVVGTTTMPPTYAKKTCPEDLTCSVEAPCQTSCGPVTRPGACVACPAYHDLTGGKCAMHVQKADWTDPKAPKGKKKVFEVCARFAWSCGDGYCDVDEDCANCALDCACHGDNLCVEAGDPAIARCCEDGQCGDE